MDGRTDGVPVHAAAGGKKIWSKLVLDQEISVDSKQEKNKNRCGGRRAEVTSLSGAGLGC